MAERLSFDVLVVGSGASGLAAAVSAEKAGARVGPGCLLRDTTVGAGAIVIHAVCESAVIGAGAVVGLFVHLSPGIMLGPGERVGRPAGPAAAAQAGVSTSEGAHPA